MKTAPLIFRAVLCVLSGLLLAQELASAGTRKKPPKCDGVVEVIEGKKLAFAGDVKKEKSAAVVPREEVAYQPLTDEEVAQMPQAALKAPDSISSLKVDPSKAGLPEEYDIVGKVATSPTELNRSNLKPNSVYVVGATRDGTLVYSDRMPVRGVKLPGRKTLEEIITVDSGLSGATGQMSATAAKDGKTKGPKQILGSHPGLEGAAKEAFEQKARVSGVRGDPRSVEFAFMGEAYTDGDGRVILVTNKSGRYSRGNGPRNLDYGVEAMRSHGADIGPHTRSIDFSRSAELGDPMRVHLQAINDVRARILFGENDQFIRAQQRANQLAKRFPNPDRPGHLDARTVQAIIEDRFRDVQRGSDQWVNHRYKIYGAGGDLHAISIDGEGVPYVYKKLVTSRYKNIKEAALEEKKLLLLDRGKSAEGTSLTERELDAIYRSAIEETERHMKVFNDMLDQYVLNPSLASFGEEQVRSQNARAAILRKVDSLAQKPSNNDVIAKLEKIKTDIEKESFGNLVDGSPNAKRRSAKADAFLNAQSAPLVDRKRQILREGGFTDDDINVFSQTGLINL